MKVIAFARGIAAALVGALSASVQAGTTVTVTIENLAPANGTFQTPFWVGFHDGSFDIFSPGSAASTELERLAEDGDTAPLSAAFTASGAGLTQGVLGGGPIAPNDIVTMSFTLDGSLATSRFFSYASMVIPSNDAFIANPDPISLEIFDATGTFVGADFFVTGADVWDAGTEVNDEIPMNTAFFGQMTPNTGTPEGGVVHTHPGYLGSVANPGTEHILADPMFAGADFKIPGYPIARITVVPAPATLALMGIAAVIGAPRRRRA